MGRNGLRSENGVAMVVALVILLVLTLIGFSSISTTTFESSITGNERVGTDAFYAAEAGLQVGLSRLPDTTAIPVTELGGGASYWSGTPKDKGSPKNFGYLGMYWKPGFDSSFSFERFQVNAAGESFGAAKELEAQVTYGPFSSGTTYNN